MMQVDEVRLMVWCFKFISALGVAGQRIIHAELRVLMSQRVCDMSGFV